MSSLYTQCILHKSIYTSSYCGVEDPSWAEVRHFVKFLDLQLQACEHSYFCDEKFVEDVMRGFKSFVVKFMIRMSTVSCTVVFYLLSLHA